ncbi:hypothetical protein AA0119_g13380 [Alternaria tenuissima]|uniref:DUF295 domain-containing protein n=1 Tax=Alternaria tenuissima TaxID=119927 RepID=A0ABY0FRC1_9PLEO|nr:hypothetical protein AA0119_g13380 [Alternaria tenuissima]RYO00486.1 hypothetical protein AA0121_g13385 [Alternaria tenuissima]RYO45373.1 hypothetical protein AA0116_g13283 [Alternaria tenuissima]
MARVIYGLTDKKVVYKRSFANAVASAVRPFTSLVTSGNNFHVGLIDGRIFSFVIASSLVNSAPAKYKFIDSNDDRLPGFGKFRRDTSEQRIKLLGCDKQVLVYSTRNKDVVLLKSSCRQEHVPLGHPVLKLRINSEQKTILLVTKEEDDFFLYRVPLERDWKFHSRIWLRKMSDWDLMALSKNGDVAFRQEADFLIYNPFSDDKAHQQTISVGDSDNNGEFCACFLGEDEDSLVYCGKKFPEIAFALCMYKKGWNSSEDYDEEKLDNLDFTERHGLEWEHEEGGSAVLDVQFDGNNLIVRMQGHPDFENLLTFPFGEDGFQPEYDYTYLALDFKDLRDSRGVRKRMA